MSDCIQFPEGAFELMLEPSETIPRSETALGTLESLQTYLSRVLGDEEWFSEFLWDQENGSPYIGPGEPVGSEYVWLGYVHEQYRTLRRQSGALQFEFGVCPGEAQGFLGRDVIWGIYFGRWADDSTRATVASNLRKNSETIAGFLTDNSTFTIATKDGQLNSPDASTIYERADDIAEEFTITVDLSPITSTIASTRRSTSSTASST